VIRNTSIKTTIGVIFGGVSPEHEISILTALQLMEAIDTSKYKIVPVYISTTGLWYTGNNLFNIENFKNLPFLLESCKEITLLSQPFKSSFYFVNRKMKKPEKIELQRDNTLDIDIIFLALHGTNGEDGAIQGLLTIAKIPFIGSGIRSSAMTMNKHVAKEYAKTISVDVLPAITLSKRSYLTSSKEQLKRIKTFNLKYPLIVKPCNLGSSIGLSSANSDKDLNTALVSVFKFDHEAMIEQQVTNLTEINVAVYSKNNVPVASVIEVPITSGNGLLTYKKKYLNPDGGKKGIESSNSGMANLQREVNSSKISPAQKAAARQTAVKLYATFGCKGIVRIDFIYDNSIDKLYFNELNSIPGSFSFYLWIESTPKLLLTELVDLLIIDTLEEFGIKQMLQEVLPFKALA
jgi:D-alanine-D-alanine ligase